MASALFALLAVILVSSASAGCYTHCRFKLCYSPVIYLGSSDRDITGPICLKKTGRKVGVFNTGEARIKVKYGFTRVSHYHPGGLTQKFTPSFFKSYSYKYYTGNNKYTFLGAIGHEVPQGNQLRFAKNKCVVLPITSYQVLDSSYNVATNVNNAHPYKSCISFYTK